MSGWTRREKALAEKLAHRGVSSNDIAEKISIAGHSERSGAAVRGFLGRLGIKLKGQKKSGLEEAKSLKPRVLYFDIETTNFKGNRGECVCMGYKFDSGPVKVVKMNDFPGWDKLPVELRDKFLLVEIRKIIMSASVLVGHYSKRFDHRFLQTRLLIHGLRPIPDTTHVDTWKIAKYQLAMSANSLKVLADSLGCGNKKDYVEWKHWRRLAAHDEKSIELIAKYCRQDIKTQYDVTQALLPICKDMPNMNVLTDGMIYACPSCGSRDVIGNGWRYTKVHKYRRFICQKCGHFSRSRKTAVDKNQQRNMY